MLTHIRRVLWAEDNISGIIDAMDAEAELDITVDVPQTLKEAIALLETSVARDGKLFSAIITDGRYPLEPNGPATLEAMVELRRFTQNNPFFERLPFIVLTGEEPEAINEAFRAAGLQEISASNILGKPQTIIHAILMAENQLEHAAGFAASALDSIGGGAMPPKSAPETYGQEYVI